MTEGRFRTKRSMEGGAGLLRFSASRAIALIIKEFRQIGRDPSALVIGVILPLFMLLVCGFGISMDMKLSLIHI